MPGDSCAGGFSPEADEIINLKDKCADGDKSILKSEVNQDYIDSVRCFYFN